MVKSDGEGGEALPIWDCVCCELLAEGVFVFIQPV